MFSPWIILNQLNWVKTSCITSYLHPIAVWVEKNASLFQRIFFSDPIFCQFFTVSYTCYRF